MIDGIINVYKEKGFTSHDVVAVLRGVFRQKKIGHTGTLDPDATGVLPVCLGRATKVCDMLTDREKTYETILLLGQVTDTQDVTGKVLSVCDPEKLQAVNEQEVIEVLPRFTGDIQQIPPMYSAKKIDGKKLYDLAREGIVVERKPCSIHVSNIDILWMDLPRVRLRITCSKGTYIRTLCHDIGAALGCGGCMEELVRTRVGPFEIENALTISEIKEQMENGCLPPLIPLDEVFTQYEKIIVPEIYNKQLYNGAPIPAVILSDTTQGASYRLYDSQGSFIGIYGMDGKVLRLIKMFFNINDR